MLHEVEAIKLHLLRDSSSCLVLLFSAARSILSHEGPVAITITHAITHASLRWRVPL